MPLLYSGMVTSADRFRDLLKTVSILGGQTIEGVVAKRYDMYGQDKKVLMAKFVSEAFKEVHAANWKNENPTQNDILMRLGMEYGTQTRWDKDIGLLFKEVWPDIEKECEDDIKAKLYAWAAPHLKRLVTRGLAEYYKEKLLTIQFEHPAEPESHG